MMAKAVRTLVCGDCEDQNECVTNCICAKTNSLLEVVDEPAPSRAEQISPERGRTHGNFADNAVFAIAVRDLMRAMNGWNDLAMPQQLALEEIALKTARVLSGGHKVKEHWDDIEGYAKLGGQSCV